MSYNSGAGNFSARRRLNERLRDGVRGLRTALLLALAASLKLVLCAGETQWHQEAGFRWAELSVPSGGKTGFKLLSPEETGIRFTNTLDERTFEARSRILSNGSGIAIGDFDNDGRPDLFFCSLEGKNVLYRNLGGMKFQDVTGESGIQCSNQFCTGAVFADVNGDGSVDLLIGTVGGGVRCFINDGRGHFSEETESAGTGSKYCSMTMALADIDGNGTLDLYVANYRTEDIRDKGQVDLQMVNGKLTVPPALANRFVLINGKFYEYGEPDILYLNDGHGHFRAVPWTNGAFLDETGKSLASPPLDWGLTATFRDLNGDGYPDLYVCNDYWTPDRIWLNDGRGHFRAADNLAIRHTSASSMGVDCADLTRSGKVDIFVADMLSRSLPLRKRQMPTRDPIASVLGEIDNRPQITRNTLFSSRGDGTFAEIGDYAGVAASDWSSSPLFVDVDLDGFEDLLVAAGHSKDVQDLDAEEQIRSRAQAAKRAGNRGTGSQTSAEGFLQTRIENSHLYPPLDMPIVAFHNLGRYQFEEVTSTWGTADPGVHHGMALADLDGDGDLDLIVNNFGSVAGIYRNETSAPRVAVQLKGLSPNTQGIGAKIILRGATVPMQSTEVVAGGHYMSASEPLAVFAPGQARDKMAIEVIWRSGKRSIVADVKSNRFYEVNEDGAQDVAPQKQPSRNPLFEDVSGTLSHQSHEEEFNDFQRQPTLPRKLSQLGPGIAWGDLDGDGWDDLVIGSGKGGQLSIFHNDGHGGFVALHNDELNRPAQRDQTGVAIYSETGSAPLVLTGAADYEDGTPGSGGVSEYSIGTKIVDIALSLKESSVGPLALGDLDGDGNLELFVGGRVSAGRYPEAATSKLYKRRDGKWQLDEARSKALLKVGLVSGAVWSDLDGDGLPELVLACEWGPIRVFKGHSGGLAEITEELGLNKFIGWWNGVTTGDLDGTGRMAIVAGNWGLNSPYHASSEHPVELYYGDFAGRGSVDIIEAEYDPTLHDWAPRRMREVIAMAIPDVPARFPTRKAFSAAAIGQVLGDRAKVAQQLAANTLASTVFLRDGNSFKARSLPAEAQFAPAFSVNITDFDGDGREDIFLSQNFFANEPEIPRCDAGRGLLLRGDGTGNFIPMPGQESGIKVYGEQRGAAVADFDHDGRVDLVVTQTGAATRLFHNVSGKPGLRVHLLGPPGNPNGIGAQLRLLFGSREGPIREIHAGSGYWSQDSLEIVLAMPERASAVWVRWPGGKTTTTELPAEGNEMSVGTDGKLAHR